MGAISNAFGYILNALYNLVSNYGVAIIIFSIFLRVILIPLTFKQQKSLVKNGKIQDEMKTLQVKYKNNPEQLNKETMELYKREGISPFSGCLSGILQIVIILAVFWLVSQPLTYMRKVNNSEIYNEYKTKVEENTSGKSTYKEIAIINAVESDYKEIVSKLENGQYVEETAEATEETEKVENTENEEITENEEKTETSENEIEENTENTEKNEEEVLQTKSELEDKKAKLEELRINMEFLTLDLSKVPSQNFTDWKVFIIPVLYVITTFISIRMNSKMPNINGNTEPSEQEESMQQMNKSMSLMMPIMSISIAAIAPLGLALYWLISNVLMIAERVLINKIISNQSKNEEEEKNV